MGIPLFSITAPLLFVARLTPRSQLEHRQVTISHGLAGSYNLQFTGQNALYKARRVK